MKIGKLPNRLLNELIIKRVNESSPPIKEVLAGPSIGEDCALLDFGKDLILVTTDPITAAENDAARLLVNVCLNDIAAGGGTPIGITVTALFPPNVTEVDIKKVMDNLLEEARKREVAIIGGHTEITDAVTRTVLSGTALGRVARGGQLQTRGAKPGDKILMTKSAGLEGAAILTGEFEGILLEKYGQAFVDKAKGFSSETSVIKEAGIAKKLGASSMHDITEGGVLGACAEAAEASGFGFEIDLRKAHIEDETRMLCEFFRISQFELISSGSLLITAANGAEIAEALEENGIKCAVIGEVTEGESRVTDIDGVTFPLRAPAADAVYSAIALGRELAKKTVVFVCTGNTCRSPMAEGFAKAAGKDGFSFCSRGICADGSPVSKNALIVMKAQGIDLKRHKSAELTESEAASAHLILAMTETHKRLLLERFGDIIAGKAFTLREYVSNKKSGDIKDPFGLDLSAYEKCAAEIQELVAETLEKL